MYQDILNFAKEIGTVKVDMSDGGSSVSSVGGLSRLEDDEVKENRRNKPIYKITQHVKMAKEAPSLSRAFQKNFEKFMDSDDSHFDRMYRRSMNHGSVAQKRRLKRISSVRSWARNHRRSEVASRVGTSPDGDEGGATVTRRHSISFFERDSSRDVESFCMDTSFTDLTTVGSNGERKATMRKPAPVDDHTVVTYAEIGEIESMKETRVKRRHAPRVSEIEPEATHERHKSTHVMEGSDPGPSESVPMEAHKRSSKSNRPSIIDTNYSPDCSVKETAHVKEVIPLPPRNAPVSQVQSSRDLPTAGRFNRRKRSDKQTIEGGSSLGGNDNPAYTTVAEDQGATF